MRIPIQLDTFQTGIGILSLFVILALFMSRAFLIKALSEKDANGEDVPSHKRVIAFCFMLTVAFCELFHTFKQEKFDFQHLVAFLVTMLLYSGIATVAQVMSIWKGNSSSITVEEKKTATTTVETK